MISKNTINAELSVTEFTDALGEYVLRKEGIYGKYKVHVNFDVDTDKNSVSNIQVTLTKK